MNINGYQIIESSMLVEYKFIRKQRIKFKNKRWNKKYRKKYLKPVPSKQIIISDYYKTITCHPEIAQTIRKKRIDDNNAQMHTLRGERTTTIIVDDLYNNTNTASTITFDTIKNAVQQLRRNQIIKEPISKYHKNKFTKAADEFDFFKLPFYTSNNTIS